MTAQQGFTCTTAPEDQPRREAQARQLAAQLTASRRSDERHATLTFASKARQTVDAFVRDESACCSFFAFEVEDEGAVTRLHIAAPAGAEPVLDGLVDALQGA